jgi:hypothetical protein
MRRRARVDREADHNSGRDQSGDGDGDVGGCTRLQGDFHGKGSRKGMRGALL